MFKRRGQHIPAEDKGPAEELQGFHRHSPDPLLGKVINGRYNLLERIGMSDMSSVYLAMDAKTNGHVAVKIARDLLIEKMNESVRKEWRALSVLRHENIVKGIECGEFEGSAFIVTEHMDGETLADALKGGRIAPAHAAKIIIQLLDALEAVHGAGMVHGDVKPANIFLAKQPDGREIAKLFDFGIVRFAGEMRENDGTFAGTFDYMAPELISGNCDHRIDIYAAGATMYEVFTGKRPFGENEWWETARMKAEGFCPRSPSTVCPGMPERLERIIMRALENEPEMRYQSIGEMRQELSALAQGPLDNSLS